MKYVPDGFADFGYDVIPSLLANGAAVYVWPINAATYLLDIGSVERYEHACRDAREGRVQILRLDTAVSSSTGRGRRC